MYSTRIITENIESFALKEKWLPVYHSLAEVESFKKYIDSLISIESNSKSSYISLKQKISKSRQDEITQWIKNEQVLCGLDAMYWATRYGWVCDEQGQIYKFSPRKSQKIYNSVIADFDEQQVSIELLILKGRQLGITTFTALLFLHRMLFMPNTQAIMASVKSKASELVARIIDTAYNRCPWWLVPRRLPKRSFDNNSILSIQSGMQATGLAQGWTPTCIHLSEIADIPNPTLTIEEGLFRAAHTSKNLFMVLEGTGRGNTGWLPETWRKSKEGFPRGRERLCPIFIPWAMCPEIYPKEDWIRKFPIENSWQPHETTRKHVVKCESYIRNTPYLAKVAGADWKMPIEQAWFWQFNYDSACKNHTQKTWSAQMPADDYESLVGTHDSVFDVEVLAELEDNIYEIITVGGQEKKERREPIQEYAITGHDVDDVFYPHSDTIDRSKEPIKVEWKSYRGNEYEWVMIPLLPGDESEEGNTMDRLIVYEPPQRGFYYACGVDTGDGLGKQEEDRTVLSVTNNRFHGDSDMQCLAPGSLVTTDHGFKKIEDISTGDTVVNRFGQYTNISATSVSQKEESLMIYTGLSSNVPLHLTLDHKVAMTEGWVEAQDVKVGDWIRYPVRRLVDKNIPNFVIHGYKQNFSENAEDRKMRSVSLPLNRDLGFTCGLYLAEGHVVSDRVGQYRGVSFTLHTREAAPWKEIIERSFPGVYVADHKVKRANAHRLLISSVKIGHWFNDTFGRTNKKHIPSWVWDAPREFVEGLVHGMVAGDGYLDNRCASVVYCSVLPSLTIGLRDLVLSLGWGLGVIRKTGRPYSQDVWLLFFFGDLARQFHIEEMVRSIPQPSKRRKSSSFLWGWNKEWIYVKVRKIKPAGGGVFHDITVDGEDPSFCVMQAAVHNCAEFTSTRVNSAQVVAFAACVGAWYGKNSPDGRGMKYAIEQIRGPGDTCQHQLKMMGFNNHHKPKRYDSKKIKEESTWKEGWYSSAWSVAMLMDRFREAVNGGWYIPKSKWLIEELRTLERHESAGKSKMEHRSGQHDDRVRAAAQSYFTAHDMDILTERAQKRSSPPKKKEPPKGPGSANQMDVGFGW